MCCRHEETTFGPLSGLCYCIKCGQTIIPTFSGERVTAAHYSSGPRWHCAGDKPPRGAYYAAWPVKDGLWHVERVSPGQLLPALATHWVDDLLGLPIAQPAQPV